MIFKLKAFERMKNGMIGREVESRYMKGTAMTTLKPSHPRLLLIIREKKVK